MNNTKIEWTDSTWNPIRGCTKVSPGCAHCYAETFSERFRGTPGHPFEHGFDLQLVPKHLHDPLKWKKHLRIFVNSMSDLFHDDVPDDYIDRVFAVMALTPRHTYQILTKRPERMREYFCGGPRRNFGVYNAASAIIAGDWSKMPGDMASTRSSGGTWWPLTNVWLGVSCEDQQRADERLPTLLACPAAGRFVSCEPLLGPINLRQVEYDHAVAIDALTGEHGWPSPHAAGNIRLDWVIVGGESGPKARPMHPDWARSIRDQCTAANVPFFFKQWGGVHKKEAGRLLDGREWNECPNA